MRDDAAVRGGSHLGNLTTDGEAAAEGDVGLDDVHAALDEVLKIPRGHVALAGGNGHGRLGAQLAVALAVVLREWFLEPGDIERLD